MTDNRTTELLCKLLEERGEDYTRNDFGITWSYYSDPHTATESMDGTLIVTGLTPEQAIAATLGSGTGEWVLEHSGTLYDKWRCSKCGYLFVEPRCDQGYMDLEANFCPKCGVDFRKVVGA